MLPLCYAAPQFRKKLCNLSPHLVDLTPDRPLRDLDLLVDEDTAANQLLLHPPHLASADVLEQIQGS